MASTVLAAALLCVNSGAIPQAAQSRRVRKPLSPAAAKATQTGIAVPFTVGERLAFRVLWSKYAVNAAAIEFTVVERRNFFGQTAWHIRAVAQTVSTMQMIYPLNDQFDSYIDAAHLASLQYEMYLHEQGKQESNVYRMSSEGAPAPANATAARVPPGTRDPIGLMYFLRATDWRPGQEVRSPVFDGHRLYDVVARLEQASGQVSVPVGQFEASKIDLQVLEHGQETSGTHFTLWLAHNEARTPVLIEVELPIGTARVELTARQ